MNKSQMMIVGLVGSGDHGNPYRLITKKSPEIDPNSTEAQGGKAVKEIVKELFHFLGDNWTELNAALVVSNKGNLVVDIMISHAPYNDPKYGLIAWLFTIVGQGPIDPPKYTKVLNELPDEIATMIKDKIKEEFGLDDINLGDNVEPFPEPRE